MQNLWKGLFSKSSSKISDQPQQESALVKSPATNQVVQNSNVSSSSGKYRKDEHILIKVVRYYYNYYKPTPQAMAGYKSGAFKYVVKPAGFLALGALGVVLLDVGYRKFHVNEDAPSIFTTNNKITPHQLLRNSDWLDIIIPEEKKKESTPNRIREYFLNRRNKKEAQVEEKSPSEEEQLPIEHDYKKFYAKLEYKPGVEEFHDPIITHIHVEKFHPFMKEGQGYWSTLIEYAMIRDRVGESNLAMHLIKEQHEKFGSKLWRKMFTNREFEQYKESNIWLEKPWILSELSIDLDMEREYNVKSLRDYIENHETNPGIQQVLKSTLNKQDDRLISDDLLEQNYYLYVSEEAFEEFKKSKNSNIRVVQKSAKSGDMFFVVGDKKPHIKDDISSLTFITHKKEDGYVQDSKQQEKKNHSPLWMRSAVVAGALGLAVSSILL